MAIVLMYAYDAQRTKQPMLQISNQSTTKTMLLKIIIILGLAFIQNISFSIVSRSRNRDNIRYHIIAASLSNTIWFLTFRQLILSDMNYVLLLPYMIGTVAGSVFGVKISMRIEKWLGATADGHVIKSKENDKTK